MRDETESYGMRFFRCWAISIVPSALSQTGFYCRYFLDLFSPKDSAEEAEASAEAEGASEDGAAAAQAEVVGVSRVGATAVLAEAEGISKAPIPVHIPAGLPLILLRLGWFLFLHQLALLQTSSSQSPWLQPWNRLQSPRKGLKAPDPAAPKAASADRRYEVVLRPTVFFPPWMMDKRRS